MDAQLRDTLLNSADVSFLTIAHHANVLLDAAHLYSEGHLTKTRSDKLKAADLKLAVRDIGYLLKQVGFEIDRWKKEERIISAIGVEIQFLNELKATLEATMLFLLREDEPITQFNLEEVDEAYQELVRCNRLL